jgi:hypothetical protein
MPGPCHQGSRALGCRQLNLPHGPLAAQALLAKVVELLGWGLPLDDPVASLTLRMMTVTAAVWPANELGRAAAIPSAGPQDSQDRGRALRICNVRRRAFNVRVSASACNYEILGGIRRRPDKGCGLIEIAVKGETW